MADSAEVLLMTLWPEPPNEDVLQRLRHTLHKFHAEPAEWMVLRATHNVYGEGVTTGLTLGDLRQLEERLSGIDHPGLKKAPGR